jgi:hypothetical protein
MLIDSTPWSKNIIWQTEFKKEDLTICCLQETHLIDRNKHWLRVNGWKKIYQASGPWKQAGVSILISDKVDLRLTLVKWDKEGHFHTNKRCNTSKGNNNYQSIHTQYQCTQFCQTNIRNLKAHIDSNTVVGRDFTTPLSPIDRSSKQKINKEILELNDTINQMNLTAVNVHSPHQPMEPSPK